MKAEDFKEKIVVDQYGSGVRVVEVVGNIARTSAGLYHTTKVFYEGKSVYRHLENKKDDCDSIDGHEFWESEL